MGELLAANPPAVMQHTRYLSAAIAILALGALFVPGFKSQPSVSDQHTFVIVHGAWGGGWGFQAVDSILTHRGHTVYRVTLTGLGERSHLASPEVGLETHITDVVNTILWEDLNDVTLWGHSYGGMVVTGVGDRIPERLRRIIYSDALLPLSGESAMDIVRPGMAQYVRETYSNGMSMANHVRDTTAVPRGMPQPYRTFTDKITLRNSAGSIVPGTFILTVEPTQQPDGAQKFADRADSLGMDVLIMEADHNPQNSVPEELVDLLLSIK